MGLHQASLPEVEVPQVPANARPSFEASEFNHLDQLSLSRIADLKCNEHVRRDRTILHCYTMIAAFSGMRTTEIKNLNWGDVLGYRQLQDRPTGERGHRISRSWQGQAPDLRGIGSCFAVAGPAVDVWAKAMGVDPGNANPVFATPNGKRLGSVKKSLQELLRTAGLLADH